LRKELIENLVRECESSFGKCRVPIDETELEKHFKAQRYSEMVSLIRRQLCLDIRVMLALVNSGGKPNSPAWVVSPSPMPMIGTKSFENALITLYLRKSFLHEAGFDTVAAGIAHEFSHVILNSLHHRLKKQEEFVDLTAMFLGFKDFFLTGAVVVKRHAGWTETAQFSYLSPEEISYAVTFMTCR
jgi:hypothetical protein